MMRVALTLASTLAAATDEHFRSALTIVVTGGVATGSSSAKANRPTSPGAVSQSWLPSRITRSGRIASRGQGARVPARRSAAMMPIASISSAQAWPTAYAQRPALDARHHPLAGAQA